MLGPRGTPFARTSNDTCVGKMAKNADFRPINRCLSETIEDGHIHAMSDWWKVICDLSDGAIFNDLEWRLTQIFIAHYCLTFIVSETVQVEDRDIITIEY